MESVCTVNGFEYTIISLLGHGKGGYSYLAEREGRQVVLKQIHHEPCDYYSFGNKIEPIPPTTRFAGLAGGDARG